MDATFDPGAGANDTVFALAIQPDGKIIIGGKFTSYAGVPRAGIARLEKNGQLDSAFNPLPPFPFPQTARAIQVQKDGKIVFIREFSLSGFGFTNLSRLNADGTTDATFDPEVNGSIYTILLDQTDRILVGGGGIERLNKDGTTDLSFDPGLGPDGEVKAIALDAQGGIYIGGDFRQFDRIDRTGLAYLRDNGSLNLSFNADSSFLTLPSVRVNALVLQPDSRLLVAGSFAAGGTPTSKNLIRLDPTGRRDATFGATASADVLAAVELPNGEICITGEFEDVNGRPQPHMAILTATGSTSATFPSGSGANDAIRCVAVQSDGNILVAGDFTVVNGVARGHIARLTCISSGSIVPTITQQPTNQSVRVGTEALFWVEAVGSEPMSYQWQFNGQPIPDATDSILNLQNVQLASSGIYSVVVSNVAGVVTSEGAMLSVEPADDAPPAFTKSPASQTVHVGDAVSFAVFVSGSQPIGLQWLLNGEPISGETGSILTIASAAISDSGTYSVLASNAVGIAVSAEATLAVLPPPGALAFTRYGVNAAGRLALTLESDPSFYYILYEGPTADQITTPVDAALGQESSIELVSSPIDQSRTSVFFRALRVPRTRPLDVDRDGIDDVFELTHATRLNAVNPNDAALDNDNDFLSDLEEYVLGTDGDEPDSLADSVKLSIIPEAGSATAPLTLKVELPASLRSVNAVEFYAGGNFLGRSTTPPYEWHEAYLPDGRYDFHAKVISASGITLYSQLISMPIRRTGANRSATPFRKTLAAGNGFQIVIAEDGTLWGFGNNAHGQLGLGYASPVELVPVRISSEPAWRSVAAGWDCTVALMADGSIWEAGIAENESRPYGTASLTRVGTENDWAGVFASESARYGIKTDGSVWVWGNIGIVFPISLSAPAKLGLPGKCAFVSKSALFLSPFFVTEEGSVWSAIDFLTPTTLSEVIVGPGWKQVEWNSLPPSDSSPFVGAGLKEDGTLWWLFLIERNVVVGSQIGTDSDWVSISAEWSGTLVGLKKDGSVWRWGQHGIYTQEWLGPIGAEPANTLTGNDWVSFDVVEFSGYGLKRDGTLWRLGRKGPEGDCGGVITVVPTGPLVLEQIPFSGFWALPYGEERVGTSSAIRQTSIDPTGNLPVQVSVDDTGGANVVLPISIPPGTAGVQPSLAVTYNSRAGNGLLGIGTALTGLSAITRVPRTIAQDKTSGAVNVDSTDAFALDGQRLIPVPGRFGSDGTEYRTEIESFSRVVAFGSTPSGPSHFKVWTKGGQILEYGVTENSKLQAKTTGAILFWSLNKVSDLKSNYFTVNYLIDDDGREQAPDRIEYTGNAGAGSVPYASVRFTYETRPDVTLGRIGMYPVQQSKRLTAVETYVGENMVFRYSFGYDVSAGTHRTRLRSVTLCNAEGQCFPATRFDRWSDPQPGAPSFEIGQKVLPYSYDISDNHYQFLAGDFNGDGRTDLVHFKDSDHYAVWIRTLDERFDVKESRQEGVGDYKYKEGLHKDQYAFFFVAGDFNGDGRIDLFHPRKEELAEVWLGTSEGRFDIKAVKPEDKNGLNIVQNQTGGNLRYYAGDFDGDGLTDLVHLIDHNHAKIWFSNGHGTFRSIRLESTFGENYDILQNDDNYFAFDINGDGRTDLVHFANSDKYWVWISNGDVGEDQNVFTRTPHTPGTSFLFRPKNYDIRANDSDFRTGDFNGDGRTDFIHFYDKNTIQLWFSVGDGTFEVKPLTASQAFSVCTLLDINQYDFKGDEEVPYAFQIGDFNGDGRTDLIQFYDNSHCFLWSSRGDGTFAISAVPSSLFMPDGLKGDAKYRFLQGDFNGDGKVDLVQVVDKTGLRLWTATGPFPDLLTHITDGQQNTSEFAFTPLTDRFVYTPGNDDQYPIQVLRGPLYVCATHWVSDARGQAREFRHKYSAGKFDLTGRGFLGFATTEEADLRTGFRTLNSFHQDFRYAGRAWHSEVRQRNGKLVSQSDTTWAYRSPFDSVPSYFVYPVESTARTYEIDGSLITTTKGQNLYDRYGNVTNNIVSLDGFEKRATNTFDHVFADESRWILGRLTRSAVTSEAPGQETKTRRAAFEYTSDFFVKAEIIEPNDPELRLRTEFQYDSFGHQTNVTLSGKDIATRSSATFFEPNGRFPVRSLNPLKQRTTYEYDPRFGGLSKITDANNLVGEAKYDGFGRKKLEERPDKTTTEWRYAVADPNRDSNCPMEATYSVTTITSGQPPTTTYLNRREQTLRTTTLGLDGETVLQDAQYDSQDRLEHVSRPYFAGDQRKWTTYHYDDFNRVTSAVLPDGAETSVLYQGLKTVVINALDQRFTQTRNSQGQVIETRDDAGNRVSFVCDAFGNVTKVEDPDGNRTTAIYDIRGRKVSMNDPDMGTWQYTNNVLSELTSQGDAKGQATIFEYDLLGRPLRRTEPEGVTEWLYDTSPHGIGLLARVTAPGGIVQTNIFDELSRPLQTTVTLEGTEYTTKTDYDALGRVKHVTYPGGFTIENGFNERGYLTAVKSVESGALVWNLKALNASGQATKDTFGNGLTTTRTFNAERGWLRSIKTGPSASIQNLEYLFNSLGNLTNRHDLRQNLKEAFAYDRLNRLTNAIVVGRTPKTYRYDKLGNLKMKSDVGAYEYGGNGGGPHAVWRAGTDQYFYDDNGNQISGGGREWSYTSFNKPLTVSRGGESASFSYGPDHSLVAKATSSGGVTSHTVYVNGLFEVVTTGAKREERHHIPTAGGVVAIFTKEYSGSTLTSSRMSYLHGDHLGSVETITDETGAAIERFSFDPHGERRDSAWNDIQSGALQSQITDSGFTGHLQLDSLDIIHMGGRAYDPVLGRMLSAAPIVQSPGNLQSLNRYSYVINSPLSLTDPSGYAFGNITHFFRGYGREVGAIAAGAAVTAITGGLGAPAWAAGAAGGAVQGAIATKGNTRAVLFSAAVAGVAHGLAGEISGSVQRSEAAAAPFEEVELTPEQLKDMLEMDPGYNWRVYPSAVPAAESTSPSFIREALSRIAAGAAAGVADYARLRQRYGPGLRGMPVPGSGPVANAVADNAVAERALRNINDFNEQVLLPASIMIAPGAPEVAAASMALRAMLVSGRLVIAAEGTETFYRTMSQAHYDQLLATGKLPATSETFISPSLEYASKYNGVTVQFNVQASTTDSLLEMGVRNAGLNGGAYGNLPLVQSGWGSSSAFFKLEGNVVNVGLGRGSALNTFNNNIVNFNLVPTP